MTDTTLASVPASTTAKPRKRIRALLLSDRIDTSNLEHDGVVSTAPLTFKYGNGGFVTLFRYGVAVLMGLTAGRRGADPAQPAAAAGAAGRAVRGGIGADHPVHRASLR